MLSAAPFTSERQVPAGGVEDLVRAAQRGDRAAFSALYTQYARMIHGILLSRVPRGNVRFCEIPVPSRPPCTVR